MNDLNFGLLYDPIDSEKLFGDQRRRSGASAERDLMFAILADAVDCYSKYATARDGRSMRLFADARDWFFCDGDEQPFSFVNVCDGLGLDPSYIRRGVLALTKRAQLRTVSEAATEQDLPRRNVKRNLKSSTRWKISSRPFRG
jgi:hypothetical protein